MWPPGGQPRDRLHNLGRLSPRSCYYFAVLLIDWKVNCSTSREGNPGRTHTNTGRQSSIRIEGQPTTQKAAIFYQISGRYDLDSREDHLSLASKGVCNIDEQQEIETQSNLSINSRVVCQREIGRKGHPVKRDACPLPATRGVPVVVKFRFSSRDQGTKNDEHR